jgi:hypothetical protein
MLIASRRSFLLGLSVASLSGVSLLHASAPTMVISKDPNCGCCSGWVEHIRVAGFGTRIHEVNDLGPIKARLSVPPALASCHTAEIGGYVIEGHVPASAVRRLLAEKPSAIGLAVPGMPVGSPGMEVPGSPDEKYDVILFGPSGQRVFATFKGAQELPLEH